jgi:hypothetical protein
MKKLFVILLLLAFALGAISGCGGKTSTEDGQKPSTAAQNNQDVENTKADGVTLADIRKAAEDSGYTVTDDYVDSFMKDVADGFAVEIVADEQDVIYSVLECKTEEAAIQNAKEIDDAGYNIAIRNGRFLTYYGVDNKDGTAKDILASILSGKAV